jgi:hypothetical protein
MPKLLNLDVLSAKTRSIIRKEEGVRTFTKLVEKAESEGRRLGRGEERKLKAALRYFGERYNQKILLARDVRKAAVAKAYNARRREARAPRIWTAEVVFTITKTNDTKFKLTRSFNAPSRAAVKAMIVEAEDNLEADSPFKKVDSSATISSTAIPAGNFNTMPIRAAGEIDLDGFIKNSEWCKNMGQCVPDWLTHKYKRVKGHIKSVKDYDVIEYFATHDAETGVLLLPATPNKDGYTLEHLKLFCQNTNKTLIALHNNEIVFESRDKKCEDPLIIEIKNGHLYPHTMSHRIRSIVQYNSGGYRVAKSEAPAAPSNVKFIELHGNALEFLVDTMLKENLMVTSRIAMANGELCSFKLGDTLYSTNPYNEHVEKFCIRRGIPYVGQCAISFFGELLEKFPKSYMNNEIRNALYKKGVKDRVHYGVFHSVKGDKIGVDINKAYRSVMEKPLDDLMFFDFGTTIEEKAFDNSFGLWYVETDDTMILNGTNWYSNVILERAERDGHHFTAKYFIQAQRKDKSMLSDVVHNLSDYFNCPQLTKEAINALSGYFGKTVSTRTKLNVDKDITRVFKYLSPTTKFYQKDGIFVFGNEVKVELLESNLPIYIQILDWANIRLHELVMELGGYDNLYFRKTDEIVMRRLNIPYNFTNEIGGYKQTDIENRKFKDSREHYVFYRHEPKQWQEVDVTSSMKSEKLIQHIKAGQSLLCSSRAGTGKSFLIGKLADEVKCVKLAYTNKAANNIGGMTIHKWLGLDEHGSADSALIGDRVKGLGCIVVDEYSMIPIYLWKHLYQIKLRYKIPFFICGDWRQLPPIDGDISVNHETIRFICDYNRCELEFHSLCRYDKELYDYLETITHDSITFSKPLPGNHICFTNERRKAVNASINKTGIFVPYQGEPSKYHENIRLDVGVPLLALTTNAKNELIKNDIFEISKVDSTHFWIDDRKFLHADVHKYFCLAYCITIHKAQGATLDGIVNIHEAASFDQRMLYTAASRAKKLDCIRFV